MHELAWYEPKLGAIMYPGTKNCDTHKDTNQTMMSGAGLLHTVVVITCGVACILKKSTNILDCFGSRWIFCSTSPPPCAAFGFAPDPWATARRTRSASPCLQKANPLLGLKQKQKMQQFSAAVHHILCKMYKIKLLTCIYNIWTG